MRDVKSVFVAKRRPQEMRSEALFILSVLKKIIGGLAEVDSLCRVIRRIDRVVEHLDHTIEGLDHSAPLLIKYLP